MTNHPARPETVAQAFDAFHGALKLDRAERDRAVEIHNEIAGLLADQEYVDGHFLQGSLARKTMVKPLRDIDMVVTLSPTFAARYTGELVEKSIRASASTTAGPVAAMQALQAALEPHYPEASFEIGKHALMIDFGDEGFTFDVVPALDEGDDVFIANTHTGNWERSNTRQLIRTVSERNQACNGRLVHQVRMTKHAVKENPAIDGAFFGLLSESITFHAVTESLPHAEACIEVFRLGEELLAGTQILDPTGEDNLLSKLDNDTRTVARAAFGAWCGQAEEALDLQAAGDHAAAIDIWRRIFGDTFPAADAQSLTTAAHAWLGGGLTSAGRVTSNTSRQVARPSRSWRSF